MARFPIRPYLHCRAHEFLPFEILNLEKGTVFRGHSIVVHSIIGCADPGIQLVPVHDSS